jgi:hypothetical protein
MKMNRTTFGLGIVSKEIVKSGNPKPDAKGPEIVIMEIKKSGPFYLGPSTSTYGTVQT